MGDIGENANEAYLASRAAVANLRPEENLASRTTVTNLRPNGNLPSRVKTRFGTKVIRGLSTGKQMLHILSNVSQRKSLFRYGHRSVPLQLQLLGSIAVYRLSAFAAATSSP